MKNLTSGAQTSVLGLVVFLLVLPIVSFSQSGNVVITSNTSWTAGSYNLSSLTVNSGATLTVAGGSTLTVSGGVTVNGTANIVLQGANTTALVSGSWKGTGVTISAATVLVNSGGSINADGQGYVSDAGPGGDLSGTSSGGSYGGLGGLGAYGSAPPAATNGSFSAPSDLGSGGGSRCCGSTGGTGGGAIRLVVSGTLTNNGVISANGAPSSGCCAGGGAGGSVYVTTNTLAGSGTFAANGGAGAEAGGGGGRIAVYYLASSTFTGFATSTATGGTSSGSPGAVGTTGFFDTSVANYNLTIYQSLAIPSGANVNYNAVTVVAGGTMTIAGGAQLTAGTLTVSGTVVVQSMNNLVQVNGSWQGAGATINAATVLVNSGGSINADGQGYVADAGPGGGPSGTSAGGSYGGQGGVGYGSAAPAATNGSATAPTDLGSGGGSRCCGAIGGSGGGAILLNVSGTLTNNGVISANSAPSSGCCAGGGAGGSVYITTATLAGSGSIAATGGVGGEASGGGGRIAILYTTDSGFNLAKVTANGGSVGNAGVAGTVYILGANVNLTVSDNLVFPPNSNLTFPNITVNNQGSLTLGTGSTLSVTNLTVAGGGTFNVGGGSTVTVTALAVTGNSNVVFQGLNATGRVNGNWQGGGGTIQAGSIQVDAGSTINADGQGYVVNAGPGGAPAGSSAGGSYGGQGGAGYGGVAPAATYGSTTAPIDLGSGGGARCCGGVGGAGGGAVRLIVSGTLTNNGIISANGGPTSGCCAGAGGGGSVYVTTATLAGSGSFAAVGGAGNEASGGGGRIAVFYAASSTFTGFTTSTAAGGTGGTAGANGSVGFFDTTAPNYNLNVYQGFPIGAGTSALYNAVTVQAGGTLAIGGGAQLTVTTTLSVTGAVVLQSTNATAQVNGTWQGGGATINAPAVQVNANGSINADGQGYVVNAGPGGAPAGSSAGGSYGGQGGAGYGGVAPAATYGSTTAPTDLGSGGGARCCGGVGGAGGGAVRLIVSGTLTNNGIISANGGPTSGCCAGAGAGGSVYVTTATLAGSGSFAAVGGAGNEVSGGGGRIAVFYAAPSTFTGFTTSTAAGGTGGTAGANGSVGFFDTTAPNYNLSIYQNFPVAAGTSAVYNAVTVQAGGTLAIGGGAQLTVTTTLSVTGTVLVQSVNNTAQLYGNWQGAGATIHAATVQVAAGGSINANGQGYLASLGPGGAPAGSSAGGSYGGLGGTGYAGILSTGTYGSPTAPSALGSGGGARCCGGVGGAGGGAFRLLVRGTLTNSGTISSNGAPSSGCCAGGGAGGSVYVLTNILAGSGSFAANGGAGYEASGGGGRVAVYYVTNNGFIQNAVTAAGGQGGSAGSAGTVTFSSTPQAIWITPTANVLHGTEPLEWFADSGSTLNVIASGPLTITLASGVSPDSGLVWDTTTVPDGRYELRLVLLDASGKTLQEQAISVAVNNSVSWHSGVITGNQEWTADQVQALDGLVVIPSGVTLTIDPGAIVKALPGAEIYVQSGGVLNAQGGNSNPVIFTTFDDSSVGGNTDFNAGGSLPSPGEWLGVAVQTGGQFNSNSNTDFRYVNSGLSGTLSSQTLQATYVYPVSGTVVVPNGATLTIQPGAILKFNGNAGISVQHGGQLIAQGTVAQPIYFTSIKDDSIGGDTNGDGNATSPAAGDWGSIVIDNAPASFVHVQMLYGGGPVSAAVTDVIGMIETTDSASVTIADSVIGQAFWNGIQAGYPNGGGDTVTITNTVLWGNEDRAINAWPGSTVHVVNDTIDGNGTGIFAHGGTVDVANTIVSNSKSTSWGGLITCCGGVFSAIGYSDVWTSAAGVPNYTGFPNATGTNGNVSANPVFVNEPQGNFQLNYGSPAIDAANGTVANYPTTDSVGDPRYNDPLVTTKSGVADANGKYPDMGAFEFVASAPSNIDLTVPAVTGPSTALAGNMVQVNWTVTNIGSGVAYGPWHDDVYLVQDTESNPVATLAGQVLEGVGAVLGPGASYSATSTIRVPGTVVGSEHWEVKTNVLGEIFEGQNTGNNTGISLDPVAVDLPALVVDSAAVNNSFASTGQSWWYKLIPRAGKNVTITLNLNAGGNPGAVQLFIGQGYVPDPQHFDIQQAQWNSPSASAVISNTSSQVYYVTAYAQSLTSSPTPFTLTASTLQFSLNAVQPATVVNIGSATLTFVGGGLTSGATYQLVGPGNTAYNSTALFLIDSAHADVTFAMNGLPVGSYTAKVTLNGTTVTLNNALAVTAGSPASSGVQVNLARPQAFRAGFPSEVTLTYKNVSGEDEFAPLLQLTAAGAALSAVPPACSGCNTNFAQQYQNTFSSGLVLGINHNGPAGVLPAGAEGSVTFMATPAAGTSVTFRIQALDPTQPVQTAIEALAAPSTNGILVGTVATGTQTQTVGQFSSATAYCNSLLPPYASAAGFSRTCMQLLAGSGYQYFATASSGVNYQNGLLAAAGFNQLLAADATVLSQMGVYESDATHVLNFELAKDFFTVFNQRYHQGAFGFGPSHALDVTGVLTSGVPTILYPDGTSRTFNTPSPSQPNQYLGRVGDYGVLSINSDGTWLLTEQNGTLSHFIVDPVSNATGRHLLDYLQDLHNNRVTLTYTNDLVTSVVDSVGNTVTFVYDSLGHITQFTDAVGRVTTYTYDINSDSLNSTFLTSFTNAMGTTTLTWNEGRAHGVGYIADSCVPSYCEPAIGISSITYPDGTHTYYTYDALGRLATQYRDGSTSKLTYSYALTGGITVTDALGNSSTVVLNQQGSVSQYTDPLANVIQVSYDPESKLTRILGPQGTSSSVSYDANGNTIGLRDPLDNLVSMGYAADGYVQSVTDALGNGLTYGYDASYDPTSTTYSDGSAQRSTYDSNGNLLSLTNRRGHTTTFTYDAHNLLLSKTFAGGAQILYSYDAHHNLQSLTTSAGTTQYTHDSADRLTGVTYPNGQSITYTYNSGGQRTSMTDSTGFVINYTYDSAGRLLQLNNGNSRVVAYTYDAAGGLTRKDLGNGAYTTFAYDGAGNILHLINYASGGSILSEYDYTYDGMGRKTSMNSPAGSGTFGYDADGQLTSVTMPGGSVQYTYDAAGNRTMSASGSATSFLVNNLNEYTAAGANSYRYDADGNLIAGGGWTYTYDDENRLIGAVSSTDTWSYQYDGIGNRISVTHNGTVTQYLNDPSGLGNILAEFDGTGHLIGHYTYGLDLASSVPAGGSAAYYHFDAAGNTVQMTNASGSMVNSYSYLPYGEKLSATTGVANPFAYAGEFGVADEGSGLYFMRNRWYHPALGRFVQVDPSGLDGGDFNFYRYAQNSPGNLIDPAGSVSIPPPDYYTFSIGAIWNVTISVNAHTGDVFVSPGANSGAGANLSAGYIDLSGTPNANRGAETNSFLSGPSGNRSVYTGVGGGVTVVADGTKALEVGVGLGGHGVGGGVGFSTESIPVQNAFIYLDDLTGGWLFNDPIVHSVDPNGKLTVGFGNQGYIPPNVPISYNVYYENQPSATAPAQKVVVTDPLSANLDWSTIQLSQIGFNNVTINVPAGLQSYTGQVNVFTDPNPVNVSASLNTNTGVLTWTMQSVDPITGGTPQNPLAGFLPPNTSNNQGTGFVTFTVSPKISLGNGAVISNQASIVFDVNSPIATNTVTNTIDNTIPTSSVTALPGTTFSTSFTVSWTGSDPNGSGIAGYNIFVSIDGGPYATWMSGTTQTSATYTGAIGHSYSFYSLGVNNVGSVQTTAGPAQTTTLAVPPACNISGDSTAGISDVQLLLNQALGAAAAVSDLNHDGKVNVTDVEIVMNAVLGLGCLAQ